MRRARNATQLWVPPEEPPLLPVVSRCQRLPLESVDWDTFERLCARLAQKSDSVEFTQRYGVPGQEQEGIDIYVRRRDTGRYSVWQCKRYREIQPADVRKAVHEFMEGDWLGKSDQFVLCTSALTEEKSLADEIEKQAARLRQHGVELLPQGATQLSERLKDHPDLVDDFFGRPWVREFCGEEAAARLKRRILSPQQVSKLRAALRRCYAHHFDSTDPGLPLVTSALTGSPAGLRLADRFVLPDILESREVSHRQSPLEGAGGGLHRGEGNVQGEPTQRDPSTPTRMVTLTTEVRRACLDWLIEGDFAVVLGDPGVGKTSLLRYVVLDLLSPEPAHETLALKWGGRLPVWVPFAMWTRLEAEREGGCSLLDLLTTWLKLASASDDLQFLVQQAVEDARLMLFVDGLDEWSNETAAHSTVALLEQFVGEHAVPAVASSRPLGFQRLGGLSARWRLGNLAGLAAEQQTELARRWFLHLSRQSGAGEGGPDEEDAQRLAESEARRLTGDVQRDSRLATLAETPLLLSGLIALSAQRLRLPRSRFHAYELMTRLLLEEQPRRRGKAAQSQSPASLLSQENRELALARLALEIHQSRDPVAVSKGRARETLGTVFRDVLHKQADAATELADHMLAVGAETLGILVEKSPQEVGFLHRTFQEFLVARHLSTLCVDDQRQILRPVLADPQWQDVVLSLCYLSTRSHEVDLIVGDVQEAALPVELEPTRQRLLAEIAFSDLHCSASVAAELAAQAFREIETGAWMPGREALVERSLDGVRSDILGEQVEAHLQQWYPARHRFTGSAYRAMAQWPREDDTADALWRGLFDEEEWNQRAAAEALANYAAGDTATGTKLIRLLHDPVDPTIAAYALHCLALGWSEEPKVAEILTAARESADPVLRLVASCHRVRRQEQDGADKELLLSHAREDLLAAYTWREDAVHAAVEGWPGDQDLKRAALESVSGPWVREGRMHRDFAGPLLLLGYPQDEEVASAIAELFRREKYPDQELGGFGPSDWSLLAESFGGHPLVSDAVDDWLEMHDHALRMDTRASLVSRTQRAKAALIGLPPPRSVIDFHAAQCLLEGWGMQDPDVASHLLKLAGDANHGRFIAHLLPKILTDQAECRGRLVELLRDEPEPTARFALLGLIDMGCDEGDSDVVEAALAHFAGEVPVGMSWTGIGPLIAGFPKHPGVRELAQFQIRNRGGDVAAVAGAYADDAEMRAELGRAITPLPAALRLRIADWLVRQGPDDELAARLLADYDEDIDSQVKTAAAMGCARHVKGRAEDETRLLAELTEGLRATGPDLSERRQAAFAGLLELDRLDIAGSTKDADGKRLARWDLGHPHSVNLRLATHLAKHWRRIERSVRDGFWDRVQWVPDELLEEMAARTSDLELTEQIVARMQANAGQRSATVHALRVRARQWRGTERLRRLCLGLVAGWSFPMNWVQTAPRILAAETLGQQFCGDTEVLDELEGLLGNDSRNPSVLIIALCEGWPESGPLQEFALTGRPQQGLLLPARVHLLARFAPPDEFLTRLSAGLSMFKGDIWDFAPSCMRALVTRLENDGTAVAAAVERLEDAPTPDEKANLPVLLQRGGRSSERLTVWCRDELARQYAGDTLDEYAFDISSGRFRSIGHILLELLAA